MEVGSRSEAEWNRLEAPLRDIDPAVEAFAARHGMALSRNDRGSPERSLRWGADPERVIQIYLEDPDRLTWNLWLCASQDRGPERFWKKQFLRHDVPMTELIPVIDQLLEEARHTVGAWSADDLEFATTLARVQTGSRLRAGSALLVLLGYSGAQVVVGVIVGLVIGIRLTLRGANLQDPVTLERFMRMVEGPTLVLGAIVGGIVVVILARSVARGTIRERSAEGIAWASGSAREVALGLAVGGLLGIGYLVVAALLVPPTPELVPGPVTRIGMTPGPIRTYWTVIALVVAPPVEEFLFRGILFSGLSRSWGRRAAAILSTALFVLLHVTEFIAYWPAAFAITALGASALALRIRASALGPAVAAHFAYNLIMVAAIQSFS